MSEKTEKERALLEAALALGPKDEPKKNSTDEDTQRERVRELGRALTPKEMHIQDIANQIMKDREAEEARKKAALERGENNQRQVQQRQRSWDFER